MDATLSVIRRYALPNKDWKRRKRRRPEMAGEAKTGSRRSAPAGSPGVPGEPGPESGSPAAAVRTSGRGALFQRKSTISFLDGISQILIDSKNLTEFNGIELEVLRIIL